MVLLGMVVMVMWVAMVVLMRRELLLLLLLLALGAAVGTTWLAAATHPLFHAIHAFYSRLPAHIRPCVPAAMPLPWLSHAVCCCVCF
jgi:hypothetical protein